MQKFLSEALAKVRGLTREAVGIIGCGLISFGCWMVYAPLGFIVCGLLLVVGAAVTPRADD